MAPLYMIARRAGWRMLKQYIGLRSLFGRGALPEFVIIGAMKGGTTSLYQYLVEHPQIMTALAKELQFFTLNFHKGIKWYMACFPDASQLRRRSEVLGKRAITGEASPYYMAYPEAPTRIAQTVPNARLIAVLRDPVDRLISHYHHMVRSGRETLPLKEALSQEEERLEKEREQMRARPSYASAAYGKWGYRVRGQYIDQLEAFGRYFKREQILVLKSEDLYDRTQQIFDQVVQFLGLEPYTLPDVKAYNTGRYEKLDEPELREELRNYFRPYNQRLYAYLGRDLGWS